MNDSIIVSKATASELKPIADAEGTIFSDPWTIKSLSSSFEDSNYLFITAKNEVGTVVGYAIGMSACGEAELLRIAVSPSERRSGVGRKLLSKFIKYEKERESTQIFLEVRKSNAPAISLYSSFGFTNCGERKNYYKNPTEDAVLMNLILGA